MDKIIKQDDKVIKLLDLKTISRIICQTDKGTLYLQIRKGENKYHFVLDAVPLSKEQNNELMELLFPVKQLEVPTVEKPKEFIVENSKIFEKKIGRPKGAKTGIKME